MAKHWDCRPQSCQTSSGHHHKIKTLSTDFNWKRCVFRTCVMLLLLFIAESIPKFGSILDLIGASTITLLTFIFPPMMFVFACDDSYSRFAKNAMALIFSSEKLKNSGNRTRGNWVDLWASMSTSPVFANYVNMWNNSREAWNVSSSIASEKLSGLGPRITRKS